MKTLSTIAMIALLPLGVQATIVPAPQPVVDLAICLDTSGSMDGLIESAKLKIWAVVNDLALIEPTPALRVALLTFGNDGHHQEQGWVRVDAPFTDDLDRISKELFALTTNGGTEFVGRVLQSASRLDWSSGKDALKLVVVAGNESADQDQDVSFRTMCRTLIGEGIMVNSIYCGSPADGDASGWQEVARLADGKYASIDQDEGTVVVATPFDAQLGTLNNELSATYIPIGAAGARGMEAQVAEDANAASMGASSLASRARTKASKLYAAAWDLVDQFKDGEVAVEELDDEDLPEEMRVMSAPQKIAFVEGKGEKRAELTEQIEGLNKQRQEYISAEMKKQNLDDSSSFDAALRASIREQATAKGMEFKSE